MSENGDSSALIDEAELVVVGAGPAGSACAARAAELGLDVILIDQSDFPRAKACGDGLTRSSVAYLHRLGLDELASQCHQIEGARLVVSHGERYEKRYIAREGRPRWASCVTRSVLDAALLDAALERGARFLKGRVDGPCFEGSSAAGVEVQLDIGRARVAGRIVVAADGATSRLRRKCGLATSSQMTASAIRRYVTTEHDLDPLFEVHVPLRFGEDLAFGYGWVFPLARNLANIGLGVAKGAGLEQPPSLRRMLDAFIDRLQAEEGARLGVLTCTEEPIGSPLAIGFAAGRCQYDNVLFTGDAARTVDPITGEGISYALHAGETVANIAHRGLRGAHTPMEVGLHLARRFPRLGQDIAPIARFTAQRTRESGERAGAWRASLNGLRQQPLLDRTMRVAVTPKIDSGLAGTPIMSHLTQASPEHREVLSEWNEEMLDLLRSDLPFASELLHREFRGGIGPLAAATALLSHSACGGSPSDVLRSTALACESTRLAHSLFDRVSDADPATLGRANTAIAVLIGDLCIARATALAAAASCETSRALAIVSRRMCLGRLLESEDQFDLGRTPERYLEASANKMGALIGLCARLGAELAGASPASAARLANFGEQLGLAAQIAEDVLDATVGDDLAGRPVGSALRFGNCSLPVIYALEESPELRTTLARGAIEEQWPTIVALLARSGATKRASEMCITHAMKAGDAIAGAEAVDHSLMGALTSSVTRAVGQRVAPIADETLARARA